MLFIILLLGVWFLFLIKNSQSAISQKVLPLIGLERLLTWKTVSIANPASVFCIQNSGTSEILEWTGGQYGICHLPDWTTCEEWAYFRNGCTWIVLKDGLEQLQTWLKNEIGIQQNIPTSDNVYKNNQVGFQLIYPKNCKIIENLEKESDFSGGIKYSDCIIEVVVINSYKEDLPLDVYLKNQMLLNSPTLSDQVSEDDVKTMLNITNFDNIETIKLAGFLFLKMDDNIDDNRVYITEDLDGNWQYIFKKGKYIVFIWPIMNNSDGSPDHKTFEQIISSIKFEF